MSNETPRAYKTVIEIAAEHGIDKTTCLRFIKKNKLPIHMVRTAGSRGQKLAALTMADADRFDDLRKESGYIVDGDNQVSMMATHGVFYAIALVPDLDPNRIKLGYADHMPSRMSEHLTAAPTAEILQTWPCRRAWEQTAIAAITAVGAQLIRGETYRFDAVSQALSRADDFFSLMPHE